MNYIEWTIPEINPEEYNLNNGLALNLSQKGYQELESYYTGIGIEGFNKIFRSSSLNLSSYIKGTGIDLGGGPGILSSFLVREFNLDKMICCEIVKGCVEFCHPIVFDNLLNSDQKEKIDSVWGSFDNIELDDHCLDFAILYDAFHHSINPVVTLKEIHRVLKPNGSLIIIDRFHNNSTPEAEIKRLLDIEYNDEFKKENFIPLEKTLTRRMNGEHEYRYKEIISFAKDSNFELGEISVLCSDEDMEPNDVGIHEILVDFKMGGFFKRKGIFIFTPS